MLSRGGDCRDASQSTSISFVPGFVCWFPFASPFPSAPGLAAGTLLTLLLWSLTSGASSTVGFGLLRTGLHTSSSSWQVREECVGTWKSSDLVAADGSKNYILTAYLYSGNDVCYFNNGLLSNAQFTLCVHHAVQPAHAFTHTFLHSAHVLCT